MKKKNKIVKKKITTKIFFWLIFAIFCGLLLGLIFASYLVGDAPTQGKATSILKKEPSSYFCICDSCKESIFGTYVQTQSCVYSGKINTELEVVNSCKECCQEYNCNFVSYNLN